LPYFRQTSDAAESNDSSSSKTSGVVASSSDVAEDKVRLYLNNECVDRADDVDKGASAAFSCSTELQRAALTLLDNFATADGSKVNYSKMRISQEFRDFVKIASCLRVISLKSIADLSQKTRLSFFTNIYNALIIHATCAFGTPDNSPDARSRFFSGASGAIYDIGGHLFSPDDIEHGVLRANKRHPYQKNEQRNFLEDNDARSIVSLSELDPRVHFVLNCGAKSCPPIKVLPEDPERALSLGAAAYLRSELSIDVTSRTVRLPKLAFWYEADFGESPIGVLRTLLGYLPEEIRQQQVSAFESIAEINLDVCTVMPLNCHFVYNEYDWGSNDSV